MRKESSPARKGTKWLTNLSGPPIYLNIHFILAGKRE